MWRYLLSVLVRAPIMGFVWQLVDNAAEGNSGRPTVRIVVTVLLLLATLVPVELWDAPGPARESGEVDGDEGVARNG